MEAQPARTRGIGHRGRTVPVHLQLPAEFSGEGGATSHWRNAEGGLLVGLIYFVTPLCVLTLVRLFRNLS